MTDIPLILSAIEQGDARAAGQLLPLVYDELRTLAAHKLVRKQPGHTLQPTALVHEAYLRLVGNNADQGFSGRGHFFAAAPTAMRRILIERARRRHRQIHGGGRQRQEFHPELIASPVPDDDQDLLALDSAQAKLAGRDPVKARLIELRHFAGLTGEEAAELLGISARTGDRYWVYARAWLRREMEGPGPSEKIEKPPDAGDGISSH